MIVAFAVLRIQYTSVGWVRNERMWKVATKIYSLLNNQMFTQKILRVEFCGCIYKYKYLCFRTIDAQRTTQRRDCSAQALAE
jgi:hypothetical protein